MRRRAARETTKREESCGNAGAVERVESQNRASHSFHEPLGNLAKSRRDSHISTAPATRADGKVENQKQVSHFPTASVCLAQNKKPAQAGFAQPAALRAA
jgi:hypothetical protein